MLQEQKDSSNDEKVLKNGNTPSDKVQAEKNLANASQIKQATRFIATNLQPNRAPKLLNNRANDFSDR